MPRLVAGGATRSCRLAAMLLVTSAALSLGHPAAAATLAGTVHYGGSLGPVSGTRPLGVLVSSASDLGNDRQVVTIPNNGGPFSVDVPPGTYYLAVFLDRLDIAFPAVGDPYEIYNHRFALPGDPITVPENGVGGLTFDFNDLQLVSGILGTLTYSGQLGSVSKNARIVILAYDDADLTAPSGFSANSKTNHGPYEIVTLNRNTYYLLAFFDLNGNLLPDPGEPFEIYNDKGMLPADPVAADPTQTNVDFAFGDDHLLPVPTAMGATPSPTQTVTPGTPAPTSPPLPCVGDCNGDHNVGINELLVGVNIALGAAPVDSCPSFDCHHTGTVTVDCLIGAVAAALSGCV